MMQATSTEKKFLIKGYGDTIFVTISYSPKGELAHVLLSHGDGSFCLGAAQARVLVNGLKDIVFSTEPP